LLGLSRTSSRYKRRHRADDAALRKRMRTLAAKHKRYGCRRIAVLVLRQGWRVNKKRIHRLWKEEGLQRARKTKVKRAQGPSLGLPMQAGRPNHVWSYDFIEDRTERGGRLRMLVVIDEFTRECLHVRIERSIGAAKVIATLEWLFLLHGRPQYIRSDNGPEFIASVLRLWLEKQGPSTLYITPGSPWENAYIESFNDKFRDECLNMHVFINGRDAQTLVEDWRKEYNDFRPHSSLNYMTPAEFALHWRNSVRPTAHLRCANAETQTQDHNSEQNPLTLAGT
jgi:transposase InsO family protein